MGGDGWDQWDNHKLLLDNYQSGPAAPYKSWVLLIKPAVPAS